MAQQGHGGNIQGGGLSSKPLLRKMDLFCEYWMLDVITQDLGQKIIALVCLSINGFTLLILSTGAIMPSTNCLLIGFCKYCWESKKETPTF